MDVERSSIGKLQWGRNFLVTEMLHGDGGGEAVQGASMGP